MSLPGVVLLFIFAYLPMLGIVIAFKDYRFNLGILGSEWVGFQNFRFLFGTDAAFRITRNTLLMNLLFISTITICALTVAILMNEAYRSRMSKYYQTMLFFPYFISWVIVSYKDLAEKYGLDLDSITKWEDMEPWLADVRDGEGITPVFVAAPGRGLWLSQYYDYDPLDDSIAFLGMKADNETLTSVNMVESVEFQMAAESTKRWVDEGYMPLEPLPNDEARSAFRAGQYATGYHVEKPGNDVEAQNAYGFEFLSKNLTVPLILDTAGATATMNAICATSKNPGKAMEVLEEFNTNAYIYNLLSRGIEGTHWVWEDEANQVMRFPDGVAGDTSTYNPNTDWMFGNQFNAYYRDAKQVGAWEATKEMNDTAFPSEALALWWTGNRSRLRSPRRLSTKSTASCRSGELRIPAKV